MNKLESVALARQSAYTPEARAKQAVSSRLEERVKIAEEKAAKLRAQMDRRQEKERKAAERRERKATQQPRGVALVHVRISALEARCSAMEQALGVTSNGHV